MKRSRSDNDSTSAKPARTTTFKLSRTAPRGFLKSYRHRPESSAKDITTFFYTLFAQLAALITDELKQLTFFLITELAEKERAAKCHYCRIKDFDRLCYDQNHHEHRKHFCRRCLSSFNTKASLVKHDTDCKKVCNAEPAVAVMPIEDKAIVTFRNIGKMLKCSYIIYAYTEARGNIASPFELHQHRQNDRGGTMQCGFCGCLLRWCQGGRVLFTADQTPWRGPSRLWREWPSAFAQI